VCQDIASANRHDTQCRRGTHQAVSGFIDGAVAAGNQHQVNGGSYTLAGELSSIARLLGLHEVNAPASLLEMGGETLQRTRHVPRARCWVIDQERFVAHSARLSFAPDQLGNHSLKV